MAQEQIIQSFLVGLGFDIDESSLAAFNKGIASAALRVTGLMGAVEGAAAGIVFAISKISQGFEDLGYEYHIIAPAINKAIILRQELLKAYSSAGINIRKVIVDSIKLNMSLAKTKFAMEAIYKSVGSKFFGLLQKQSDEFRKKLYANMPYIINALTHLVSGVFKAFDVVTVLGGRLWSLLSKVLDFFIDLDHATNGWSTTIIEVIAAWKLLNLAFITTPLGAIITGLLALIAIYDDFKTYKEGGKSLFNWGPVIPYINDIVQAMKGLKDVAILTFKAVNDLFHLRGADLFADIHKLAEAFVAIDSAISGIINKLSGGGIFSKILQWRDNIDKSVFGGAGTPTNPGSGIAPILKPQANPLGSSTGASNTNINANMQTAININGSPDASSTGRFVAGEQNNVNRDFVRNLTGSVA